MVGKRGFAFLALSPYFVTFLPFVFRYYPFFGRTFSHYHFDIIFLSLLHFFLIEEEVFAFQYFFIIFVVIEHITLSVWHISASYGFEDMEEVGRGSIVKKLFGLGSVNVNCFSYLDLGNCISPEVRPVNAASRNRLVSSLQHISNSQLYSLISSFTKLYACITSKLLVCI